MTKDAVHFPFPGNLPICFFRTFILLFTLPIVAQADSGFFEL